MSDSDSSEDSDSGRFKTASTQSTFNNQRRSSPAKTSNIYRRRSRSRSNPRNHRDNNIRDKKDHRDVKKDKPRRRSLEKSRDIKERPKEHHERLDRQKDESGRVKDHQKINKRSRSKSKSRSINSDTKSRSSTSDKKTCHESSFPRQKTERDTNKDSKNSREKEVNELKKTKKPSPAEFREESKKNIDANYGPALPPAIVLKKQSPSTESFVDKSKTPHISKESVSIGPALPPGFKKSPSLEVSELELSEEEPESRIGPIIPCDLQQRINHYSNGRPASRTRHHYEAISSSENDEDFVGPVPSGSTAKSARDLELERRKIEMKLKELDERNRKDEDVVQREEWMTELPKIKMVNDLGLGARQFRTKERPDFSDRTQWTDNPNDSKTKPKEEKKVDNKKELEIRLQEKKDAEQEKIALKHKKKHKRDKSLLDHHLKKLKKDKKKKEDEGKVERRPFSRDDDLKVNKFDEAQKKAIFKKAQLLDTRFSKGSTGKYL